MGLKVHVDGLFTCYVVDWRRIPPHWVGGKPFPFVIVYLCFLWVIDVCQMVGVVVCGLLLLLNK